MIDFQGNQTKLEAGDMIVWQESSKCFLIISRNDKKLFYDKRRQPIKGTLDNKFYFNVLKDEKDFLLFVEIIEDLTGLVAKKVELLSRNQAYEFYKNGDKK